LKDIELATPAAGLVSGIYLVVPVSDVDKNHVTLHFRKLEDGRTVVVVGTGRNVENSPVLETVRTIDFTTVTALRIARYRKTLTCLVSSPEFDHDQIVATFEFPEAPIPSAGLQIHLHTGGNGLESEVVIPRVEIRATKIGGECCHAPEAIFNFAFEVEHIIPRGHAGTDSKDNWALACRSCNLFKSNAVE